MARLIVLLRGVNLGPSKRVKMAELREVLSRAGYEDVRTLVNSGNVVLSTPRKPASVEKEVHALILGELGVDTSVIVRTRDELADAIARCPYPEADARPKHVHVSFLKGDVDPDRVALLGSIDFGEEAFEISGRELFAWHPEGLAESALAKELLKGVGADATSRNWNTVTKLLALADET
jgi:uncharacterized protein (DUF1697 family)